MALMHFQHKSIGKSTHAKRAATASIFYITRDGEALMVATDDKGQRVATSGKDLTTGRDVEASAEALGYNARDSAASITMAGRMPEDRNAAASWFEAHAKHDRSNARIADTFIMALPLELTKPQRVELLRDWCETVTQGKAAYFAAIHDKGKDEANPHAHVIIRDRDYSKPLPLEQEKQRGRVIGTTTNQEALDRAARLGQAPPPRMTTYDLRDSWANVTNRHLELAGCKERVDARSFKEQGIDRKAGIHEGPKGRAAQAKGHHPASKPMVKAGRVIPYDAIDDGVTRRDANHIIALGRLLDQAGKASQTLTADVRPTAQTSQQTNAIANGNERMRGEAPSPDVAAKLDLKEQHRAERRELAGDQYLDRQALAALHKAETAAMKAMTAELFGNARAAAFAGIGAEFGARWEAVWKLESKEAIASAAGALRIEQQAAFRAKADQLFAEANQYRDTSTRAMKRRQAGESKSLRLAHIGDSSTLSGEQAAERQHANEQWKAGLAHAATVRAQASESGSQSMPAVQRRAMGRMQAKVTAAARAARGPQPMHPDAHTQVQAQRMDQERAQTDATRAAAARAAKDVTRPVSDAENCREQTSARSERVAKTLQAMEDRERRAPTSDEAEKATNITRNKGGRSDR